MKRQVVHTDKVPPARVPLSQAIRVGSWVEFVVNLKTARALGIKVPQSLLRRADRVIE